ncbi:hypothetical protein ASPCADRAFT_135015 [Aspergillus carbonarius ITEM 5010]|uniref:Acyl-CoA dehydrogenase/oxidase C-terminal domain-containing protein n=1 Tax=Aspergillus carbonarius (strain ITEM 5010) TaxID=602072 RepID=A0A1R3R8D3_ASPC5|nr:hypothetical protein ASPCADRAFT_135015 [Aspergillus carbonarius ITEM 5010]
MVDFTLSPSEQHTQAAARRFAATHLASAAAHYSSLPTPEARFQSLRSIYEAAVTAGLLTAQVPAAVGGSSTSLVDAAILVEEFYAVEASASLTIFGTGLGLTPLALAYRPDLHDFLAPFLSGTGSPLASLVFSEPGGVMWATNSAGWDFQGADLSCVVCRCINEDVVTQASHPRDLIMVVIVTRADVDRNPVGCFHVVKHVETAGHVAVSGPHIKYTNLRVPAKNVLCAAGTGAPIVTQSFDISAMLVGAMGTGIQRAVFDAALQFSRDPRGGTIPIGQRQSVADRLIDIKMRTETSRLLTWKAAHCLLAGPGEPAQRREPALLAKIYASDASVQSCIDAINAVGVSAYNVDLPFASLLSTALVLPIFDGGNVGIRRRAVQELFMAEGYQSWTTSFGLTTEAVVNTEQKEQPQ